MSGVSIEATLELWASCLRDVKARMRPLFSQVRMAASASLFLDGLLGAEPRETGWMWAKAAGDPDPGASRRSSTIDRALYLPKEDHQRCTAGGGACTL